jgi:Zn-dependent protease with chaperone function
MDFFERQDQARRSTKLLIVYFGAGVVLLTCAVYLVVAILFVALGQQHHHRHAFNPEVQFALWNPKLFLGVAIGTCSIIAIGSISKTLELARGGSVVASQLGGRLVNPTSTNPDERKLLNVVEEMSIAAGIPMPQVYVLPGEHGINAFAAGHTTSDAVVAVTSGAMRLLSRDELQGVIGHEFSHILNGDMRLNIRLMGIIFGILCLTVIGRVLLQIRVRSSRDRNPLPLLGLALIVIGWVGVLFGRLIQTAVSRQREFLADASAVQFTRNPEGLAGALKKIGGLSYGSRLQTAQADAASHMYFSNGVGSSFLHLLDTHPSLTERIVALDPSFDGVFPVVEEYVAPTIDAPPVRRSKPPVLFPLPGRLSGATGASGFSGSVSLGTGTLTGLTGTLSAAQLRYAEELRAEIPQNLRMTARESLGATALVYALLLSDDSSVQSKQLEELEAATSPATCHETLRVLAEVQQLSARAKLPLLNLSLAGLRQLSKGQYDEFSRAIGVLVDSDGQIDLFEYMLQKAVMRHLEPQFIGVRKPVIQYYALKPLAADCATLLSALAFVGQDQPEEVQQAFDRGAQLLNSVAQFELSLITQAQCDLDRIDAALNRLAQSAPQIKKNVLEACGLVVAADGLVRELEAELLRAVADALDCPLPPLLRTLAPETV